MILRSVLAACAVTCAPGPVQAELLLNHDTGSFSAADREVIQRNALLRDNLASRPWLVRRILDLPRIRMAQRPAHQRDLPMSDPAHGDPFDATSNPDLAQIDRSSSEAANDLFQLLKQAQPQVPPPPAR